MELIDPTYGRIQAGNYWTIRYDLFKLGIIISKPFNLVNDMDKEITRKVGNYLEELRDA